MEKRYTTAWLDASFFFFLSVRKKLAEFSAWRMQEGQSFPPAHSAHFLVPWQVLYIVQWTSSTVNSNILTYNEVAMVAKLVVS